MINTMINRSVQSPRRRTGSDPLADLVRVEVLIHQAIDDVWNLRAKHQVACRHQVGTEQLTKFLKLLISKHLGNKTRLVEF